MQTMEVFITRHAVKAYSVAQKNQKKTVGFVPTMGALHEGHLALVQKAKATSDIVIVSIFVNPTQFDRKEDLKQYPRTFPEDKEKLRAEGADAVFAPSVGEMYPQPDTRIFDFGHLAEVMEGKHRPGHFNGVAQIVSKLFDAVVPDMAFFGEKDFQQLQIIRRMTKMLDMPVRIIPCPIVREKDGLAMSSRNVRLSPAQREAAPLIYQTLQKAVLKKSTQTPQKITNWVIETLNKNPELEVEYFELVDGPTLRPIQDFVETSQPVGCIAVFAGKVRLIDNIRFDETNVSGYTS